MKKTIMFALLALVNVFNMVAQGEWWEDVQFMPLVQEGVKWVNEKVIISHGDTTSYYYTYEIQGDDTEWHWYSGGNAKLCHYYTGNHIDYSNDSIISSLEQGGASVDCFNNWAYDKVVQEGRNIIPHLFWVGIDEGELLYRFYPGYPEAVIIFYINAQDERVDPVLTNENFKIIEPIEIDGYICNRYSYIKETGDTMCYLVEGIGFDSRNMGDLLTPFTREPDPDADYQEYCGLCHVVKDGQIIYKGMRYTPDNMTGIDEVVADQRPRQFDDNYYNLMGQPVGTELPTTPGIYIHHGKKIVVNY